MEPEIDRRCPDCGAAVRAQSAFCPQCGKAMKASAVDAGTPAAETESARVTEAVREDKGVDNSARPLAVTAASNVASEPPPTAPSIPETISLPAQVAREQITSGNVIEPLPEKRPRGKGQRVVGAARDVVEERLAPRVERLRQASNVVWGEAQDDPNLRFILVAVFLFILAMVIILLGTYLR
jgi:endogenous inhibitor of DNA gyrase (YacG/DUF329 family)